MPKNLLQDMVKEKRERRGVHADAPVIKRVEKKQEKIYEYEPSPRAERKVGKKHKSTLWAVAGISLIFLFFALSYFFAKVTVTVNPKVKEITLSQSFSATKDTSTNTLPFDIVVISGMENEIIPTTEQKEVLESARGAVVIYNTFSTASQRLDIDTRLEGSNGKMYKTDKAVVVPGMKGATPGSVEVNIYAAEKGPDSNSVPLDFKIFGFKGTPKYSKFYARSNVNDPITKGEISGGLVGKFPVVPDAQKEAILNSMRSTLQTKLFKKANDQIPEGFIMFKDAAALTIGEGTLDLASATGNSVPISTKGTFYGILFNEAKLAKKIAEKSIPSYDGNDVYIQNIQDMTFSLTGQDGTSLNDSKNITFNLKGDAKVVWRFDEEKLATDLIRKSKDEFNKVLLQYPNIDSAESNITPFWKSSFPDKLEDIHIIVNYPK